MHSDPSAAVVLALALILVGAQLFGHVAERFGQPSVVGELLYGLLLGNLGLVGLHQLDWISHDASLDLLARIGLLLLLFEVGLGSTVPEMLQVGLSSLLVALVGVLVPFALGWGVGAWLLPDRSIFVHAFLGATLTATSVGITARVLSDLGHVGSREARVILGAAVIDDVLGLIVLAVVSGVISTAERGNPLSLGSIAGIIGKAAGFLLGSLVIGALFSRRLMPLASRLTTRGTLLALSLAFCFVLGWLADRIGLQPLVGAFAAGLLLEDIAIDPFHAGGSKQDLKAQVEPLTTMLAPIFFVLTGAHADLTVFGSTAVLGLAALLTVAAIIGKLAAGLGVLGGGVNRLAVSIGMIPRGEVGLVFASIGGHLIVAGEPVIDRETFGAVLIMVLATTLLTPPALKLALGPASPPSAPR